MILLGFFPFLMKTAADSASEISYYVKNQDGGPSKNKKAVSLKSLSAL
jgi:hypothetical protein